MSETAHSTRARFRKSDTPEERFWSHVAVAGPEDCWPWTAGTRDSGYGQVRDGKKVTSTHRMAWIFTNGDPGDLWVLHRCDNPPCCNPGHLFLGTSQDNVNDMMQKGRNNPNRGEASARAKLTDAQVLEIRRLWGLGAEDGLAIAAAFGIKKAEVSNIVTGRTWAHLPLGPNPPPPTVRRAGRPRKTLPTETRTAARC